MLRIRKRAEVSEVTIKVLLVVGLIIMGIVLFFLKAKDFKALLGLS